MKFLGKQLEFISLIKRDGSGTIAVGTEWNTESEHAKTDCVKYLDDEAFSITCLSLTNRTYIASGFNSWVVKVPELWK